MPATIPRQWQRLLRFLTKKRTAYRCWPKAELHLAAWEKNGKADDEEKHYPSHRAAIPYR